MKDYKILVTKDTIPEVLELFKSLGYKPYNDADFYIKKGASAFYAEMDSFSLITGGRGYVVEYTVNTALSYYDDNENIELTLDELRELVALNANSD